jgi:hypothetical protein
MMRTIEELQNFFKPPLTINIKEPLQCFAPNNACVVRSEFLKITMETQCTVYLPLFFDIFVESPNDALDMLIELRNPKYGKSKKHICRVILFALSVYYPDVYESFLDNFIENGCWVDVLWITKWSIDAKLYSQTGLHRMAKSIKADLPIAAKWAPNEKSKWNHAPYYLADKLMGILGVSPKEYRHKIVELRKQLNLVETNMSTKQFDNINFAELTSAARKNYANAFDRNHNAVKQVSQDRIELSRRYTRFMKGPSVDSTSWQRIFGADREVFIRTEPVKIDCELFHTICE